MVPSTLLPTVRGQYKLDYNLSHLTWFKVGGPAEIFYKPLDISDLSAFLAQNREQFPIQVIGAGSNLIIRDRGIAGFTIKLGRNFTMIALSEQQELIVGAGCLNYNLARYAQQIGIQGFEFLVGIPGTVGGGVAMNAGAYGSEFKDIVLRVQALDQFGNVRSFTNDEIGFSYRNNNLPDHLIFTTVVFKTKIGIQQQIIARMQEIIALRAATQPVNERTGGSTFANHGQVKVWELIDQAGLRGYQIGGAQMSKMHCNFMINNGSATAADLEQLGECVRSEVWQRFGIDLIWEIKRIGKK